LSKRENSCLFHANILCFTSASMAQTQATTKTNTLSLSLKNKAYLFALMIPQRTLNIHGTFPIHTRFFIVEYFNVLHTI